MKTAVALSANSVVSEIGDARMKEVFRLVCSVRDGRQDAKEVAKRAEDVHALQVLADKFSDIGAAISESVKAAEGEYYRIAGNVTEGFRLKDNGSTSTIKDLRGFLAEAEANGANMQSLADYVNLTPKNAAKWLGMSDDAFALTYEEFIETKPKAKSLQREY